MNAVNVPIESDQEELDLLRESAASFCEREAPASRIKTLRNENQSYSSEIFQQIAELGWLSILVDENAGGLGLNLAAMAAVVEQTGKQALSEPLIEVGVISALITSGLHTKNTLAQSLAQNIASGEQLVITASEAFSTTHTENLPSAATKGDVITITGVADCVPYFLQADTLLLPVLDNGTLTIVALRIDHDKPDNGLTVNTKRLADGTEHSHLVFESYTAPSNAIIGSGKDAERVLERAVECGHLLYSSYLFGLMSECFDITLEYLRTRVQFDQPIGSFQALQHRAVDLFVQRELAGSVVKETIAAAQHAENLDALQFLASRAQYRAIEASRLITREAIQMHGAIGFTYECDVGHFVNRALVIAARSGNASWHQQRIELLWSGQEVEDAALNIDSVANPNPEDWNTLTDDDFRTVARDWFEKEYPTEMRYYPRRFRWAEIKAWYLKLSEHGWVAPNWPKEFGGMGLSPSKMLIFMEEQERWGIGRAPDMGILMMGPLLIQHGTPEQQAHYLPKILAGENVWCQGYSEPNAGSDLASLKTAAVSDGDNFIVNGQKTWTTLAQDATHMFLLVRTSSEGRKQSGISFLLVDVATPGITIRPIKNLAGDEEFCEVFLDNVVVPKENIVGELNAGWAIAKALLSFERIFIGSPKYSQYTLKRIDEVVAVRELHRDRGFMERCTKLRADVLDLETVFMKFAEIVRTGGVLGPDVSLLKIWATETFTRLTELLIEASGSYGAELEPIEFTSGDKKAKANTMGQFYNARPAPIYGGSNEVQRNIIAKHVLGLP